MENTPATPLTEAQIRQRLEELHLAMTEESTVFPGTRTKRNLSFEEGKPIYQEYGHLIGQLKEILLARPDFPNERIGFAVAGWDQKHNYFRNRYAVYDTLAEAKECLAT